MKQITWQKPEDGNRAKPVYRDNADDKWTAISEHPQKMGGSDFERFQHLLKLGYEGVNP